MLIYNSHVIMFSICKLTIIYPYRLIWNSIGETKFSFFAMIRDIQNYIHEINMWHMRGKKVVVQKTSDAGAKARLEPDMADQLELTIF